MKHWLAIAASLLFVVGNLQAQCAKDAVAGTDCVSPLNIIPPPGGSPTTAVQFTPETAQYPCVKADSGKFKLCGKPSGIFVDLGAGCECESWSRASVILRSNSACTRRR